MKIVKGLWKVLVGVKDALALCFLLLFFGLIFAALSARPNPAAIASGALLLDLDGSVVEQPAEARPLAVLSGSAPVQHQFRLRDILRALGAAAGDGKVKAVVLDLDHFEGGGLTAMHDLGTALDKVRAAGKPVLAYAGGYADAGYLLAAHASEVWLDPLGQVSATGPGGSELFYKALLDRVGANAHVYRVGKFKSAVEPFLRNDASPEARQEEQDILRAIWGQWQAEVAQARPRAQIARYLADPVGALQSNGGDPARAALRLGFADRLGDRNSFGRRVAQLAGSGDAAKGQDFRTIDLDDYVAAHPAPTVGAAIGVVTVAGDILDSGNTPGAAIGDDISRRLGKALATDDLKALVVRIDSPGGSVTGSETIRAAVEEARRRHLPIVVSMGSIAASGGYWVATAGDRILAEPGTVTGSIGVFGVIPTFEGTLGKLGIGVSSFRATPFSGQPDPVAGTTPAVDQLIQLGVNNLYARFTGLVAAARHMSPQAVDAIGQGRVWPGTTARRIGLIDGFGTLDEAVAAAARLAKLDPGRVHPVYIERAPSWLGQLLRGWSRHDEDRATAGWARMAVQPDAILARAIGESRMVLGGPVMQARCLACEAIAPPSAADRASARQLLATAGL